MRETKRASLHYTLSRVIERCVDSPPLAPDDPNAFRLAGPGKVAEVLIEAGAMAPSERLLQFTIQARISAEDCRAVYPLDYRRHSICGDCGAMRFRGQPCAHCGNRLAVPVAVLFVSPSSHEPIRLLCPIVAGLA